MRVCGRKDGLYCARMRCEVILSSAEVLAKSTPTLVGVAISADFHAYRNCETFVGVQFADCSFGKTVRITGSTFQNCTFFKCNFSSDFFDCSFINCKFVECEFWRLLMTSISLESTEIVESEFRYCFLNAIMGGVIADCSFDFCKLHEFESHLENCKLNYVSINEDDESND